MKTTSSTAMPAGRIAAAGFGLVVMVALLVLLAPRSADAATTFTVNRTSDAGDLNINDDVCDTSSKSGEQCTLRAAIQEANANGNPAERDTINFGIPGNRPKVKTINVGSSGLGALPIITEPVTIDGYTQRGARANSLSEGNDARLRVQLNGTNAGATSNVNGLTIRASGTTIKGLVINRFGGNGVDVQFNDGNQNRVEGNFIGTNASGTVDRGNGNNGVRISAENNLVGGTSTGARNIISGNEDDGVEINGANENTVEGNYIGTNAKGTADLGNGRRGVAIFGGQINNIGGTVFGARNVISGNAREGVEIAGSSAGGNEVEGNHIGTNAAGSAALGNGENGVFIFNSFENTIGGETLAAGNLIAHNEGDGVLVFGDLAAGNRVLSNFIFSNGELGIDLGPEGVTDNDPDDPDTGPNRLQNFPVIDSATRASTGPTIIRGRLDSNPSQSFTIQCFVAGPGPPFAADPDPSGHGEGQIPAGQDTTVTTNANGAGSFTCSSSEPEPGQTVSATATNNATGDTSEFSQNVGVVAGS